MSNLWYNSAAPIFDTKTSKSILHPFILKNYDGLAINPYQGCQHRCAYCYATYDWSPEFYDKIYAKSNAPEVLDKQLASWKSDTIDPVMVSSATDAYQPSELRFNLTRRCIEVLQKYDVPYYIFTKSIIIERDLELHKKYRHNCFIIWSITTYNERIRRIIEPGTPTANRIFETIKKFTESGLCCGITIDPIMPLITDGDRDFCEIVDRCKAAGLQHIFGEILRLRDDIWKRMKIAINLLKIPYGVDEYKRIYHFEDTPNSNYIAADKRYAEKTLGHLKQIIENYGMSSKFPDYVRSRRINKFCSGQTTLLSFVA